LSWEIHEIIKQDINPKFVDDDCGGSRKMKRGRRYQMKSYRIDEIQQQNLLGDEGWQQRDETRRALPSLIRTSGLFIEALIRRLEKRIICWNRPGLRKSGWRNNPG
jgi:hypothetical protein